MISLSSLFDEVSGGFVGFKDACSDGDPQFLVVCGWDFSLVVIVATSLVRVLRRP